MSKVYVIADLHLGHDNCAKWRGFDSAKDQDSYIKAQWNSVISKRDIVWILGDVAMNKKFYPFLDELNGVKRVVLGNHDLPKYIPELLKHVNSICGLLKYQNCILSHIPIHESELERFGKNIHGHLHSKEIKDDRYICVSCEQIDYKPIELSKLTKRY